MINFLGEANIGFAQFNQSTPQTFQTYLSNGGNCPNLNYKGSVHFNTQTNKLVFCTGTNSFQSGSTLWSNVVGGIAYTAGNVGIGVTSPTYNLEMGSSTIARFANNLLITDKMGINTITPTEKLEILDGRLTIRNIFGGIRWEHLYSDAGDAFQLNHIANNGAGFASFFFNLGGNMGIGVPFASSKLTVNGHGSFAGNVSSDGKGLLQNSNSTQLKYVFFSVIMTNPLIVLGNSCGTYNFDLPQSANAFNSPPAISFSKKANDGFSDDRIIINIEEVTATTAKLRFCNTSATLRTISDNEIYNLMAFGEGN